MGFDRIQEGSMISGGNSGLSGIRGQVSRHFPYRAQTTEFFQLEANEQVLVCNRVNGVCKETFPATIYLF